MNKLEDYVTRIDRDGTQYGKNSFISRNTEADATVKRVEKLEDSMNKLVPDRQRDEHQPRMDFRLGEGPGPATAGPQKVTLMKLRFIHPTLAQAMHEASMVLAILDAPLAIGATLTGLPAGLGWLTTYWPLIFLVAFTISRIATVFGVTADPTLAAQATAAAVQAAHVAGIIAGARPPSRTCPPGPAWRPCSRRRWPPSKRQAPSLSHNNFPPKTTRSNKNPHLVTKTTMNKFRSLPLVGFILRYWLLILFAVVAVSGTLNDTVFAHFGTLIYIVGVSSIVIVVALLIRHLFFRETLDRYVAQGDFTREWEQMTPWARQILAFGYFATILLAVAIVAGLMGK